MVHKIQKSCILAVLWGTLILCTPLAMQTRVMGQTPQHGADPQPGSLEDVLWWLPEDTETLYVAQGPFRVRALKETIKSPGQLETALRAQLISSLLAAIDEEKMAKQVIAAPLLLAVDGERNFRAPRSLGLMPFDGCQILVFDPSFFRSADDVARSIETHAVRTEKINGHNVSVHTARMEDDDWTFFVARPKPNIFLAATNGGYLTEVLDRMTKRGSKRALPEELPEWKHVDRQASIFVLRHFDRKGSEHDPSSPFRGKKAGNMPDEEAVGVAFSYSASQGDVVRLKYFSKSKDVSAMVKNHWDIPDISLVPEVKEIGEGTYEISYRFDFKNRESPFYITFLLSSIFGHGVYL